MRRLLCLAAIAAALPAAAQESRPFTPIGRPGAAATAAPGAPAPSSPAPAIAPAQVRDAVNSTVEKFAKAWNTPELAAMLSPQYYDRDRVLDALVSKVPRDATLRVLGVQAVQVLSQAVRPTPDGLEEEVVTRVSVTLRTQIEFNDQAGALQRRDGMNEAIFTLREIR